MHTSYWLKWSCATLFHYRYLCTVCMEKLTAVRSFTLPELIQVHANNEVTLHRCEILPQSEISNHFEFNSGLMWTCSFYCNYCIFVIFTGMHAYNVCFEKTWSSALIFHYNEKNSIEWVSFWINLTKKTNVSFKSQLSLFPLSKVLQNCVNICVEWI